ncbi:hypothetical protein Tco_0064636 [Tanacetum coccineum]
MPPKPDLSFTGLEEFTNEPVVIKPVVENSEAKPKAVKKNNGAPIIEDWVSDSEEEDVSQTKIEKKTAKTSFVKIDFVKAKQTNKTDRKTAKQNFAKKTHPCPKKNIVPRAVLMKSGLVSINNARQVNVAHTKTTVNATGPMSYLSEKAHSTVKRPIHKNTAFKNSNFNQRVNTVKDKNVNTVRPKAVVNAVKGNNVNVVKASACWVWKPKTKIQVSDGLGPQKKLIFLSNVQGNPQMDLQDQGVIDSGCSRHMTRNMSYLTDYEEIDGGYVAFGGNPKGGKITRKGSGPDWLFDIDALTRIMNYEPIVAGTQSNGFAGTKASDNAGQARKETEPMGMDSNPLSDDGKKVDDDSRKDSEGIDQEKEDNVNSTNNVNAASTNEVNAIGRQTSIELPLDPNMPELEDYSIFKDDEDVDEFYERTYILLGITSTTKEGGIFISQDKYVDEILKKFGFTKVKTASTPIETQKPLLKDEDGEEVDVHMYRSMIGSLMYLTSSRHNIMFAVCACARYQVNPKVSHLHDVKRIFRYLKDQPKLGLWYLKDSPFDLVPYTDSDYAGASLDRKSTTGDCQFL